VVGLGDDVVATHDLEAMLSFGVTHATHDAEDSDGAVVATAIVRKNRITTTVCARPGPPASDKRHLGSGRVIGITVTLIWPV
jgi:hypothetical protein